jgi:hypothetical protein
MRCNEKTREQHALLAKILKEYDIFILSYLLPVFGLTNKVIILEEPNQ